jgi:dihydroorotase
MKVLLRKVQITDPQSPHNGQVKDILIQNGFLSKIADQITETADQVIEHKGLQVSPGWVDLFANFCDPGYEFKETVETGTKAAAAGGFTHVMLIPNTQPVIHSKSQVEYLVRKGFSLPVELHPLGAVSRNAEGKELAEMYDMHASGALGFSDGLNPIQSAGLLLKALQYVKSFDGTIIQIPDDRSIGAHGLMNEGVISTRLGLPGKPAMSEEIMVARDIKLARYTNSKLHFTGVSSQKSLEYIQRAKEGGIAISCSVTPYHLFYCDEDLADYDTNLKVDPPLRTRADRDALREAVRTGLVDCVATHHQPHEWDSKTCEFEYAKFGMIGLESCFGVISACGIPVDTWIKMNAINARDLFKIPAAILKEGERADLTLFSAGHSFTFGEKNIRSKSKNSPFIGQELKGTVLGIINGEKLFLNN